MKNKYYTLFIASDQDASGRSFRFSIKTVIFLLLISIIIISLAIIGVVRFTNADILTSELNDLKKYKTTSQTLINLIKENNEIAADSDVQKLIIELAKKDLIEVPNFPPVNGYVTRAIDINNANNETPHYGIDIASKFGTTIQSAGNGIVVFSGFEKTFGNTIIIKHKNDYLTLYGHNDTNLVKLRDIVSKEQIIAKVGTTGVSHGPHLHFEIWQNNNILDPRELIEKYKKKDLSNLDYEK
tara:strand:- start:28 stop:750 length:723 start_codon:yes stop_codon:yes gene_type:complete